MAGLAQNLQAAGSVTAMGEGLAAGLNPEPAEGLKLAAQGNRVSGGSPAIGIAAGS